ncbi:hypothetical protein KUIN1_02280 [Pseudomonas sp. KUIN-1]|nr:hypothetical protein CCL21_13800 [Pseudomonas syringae]BBN61038.1 hypothetical protein KUIN1_02280 [Pseudomonas sp. KUIN-1]
MARWGLKIIAPTLRVLALMCVAARMCDAERHGLHANAEHWHDGHLKIDHRATQDLYKAMSA